MTQDEDRSERILVKYPVFKAAVARIQSYFDSHETTAEPYCCPIVGESGSGKTTIISYFGGQHPRVDHKWGSRDSRTAGESPRAPNSEELRRDSPLSDGRSALVTREHGW